MVSLVTIIAWPEQNLRLIEPLHVVLVVLPIDDRYLNKVTTCCNGNEWQFSANTIGMAREITSLLHGSDWNGTNHTIGEQ